MDAYCVDTGRVTNAHADAAPKRLDRLNYVILLAHHGRLVKSKGECVRFIQERATAITLPDKIRFCMG
jgi:hypothetical protein